MSSNEQTRTWRWRYIIDTSTSIPTKSVIWTEFVSYIVVSYGPREYSADVHQYKTSDPINVQSTTKMFGGKVLRSSSSSSYSSSYSSSWSFLPISSKFFHQFLGNSVRSAHEWCTEKNISVIIPYLKWNCEDSNQSWEISNYFCLNYSIFQNINGWKHHNFGW